MEARQHEMMEILLLLEPNVRKYDEAKVRLRELRKIEPDSETVAVIDLTIARVDAGILFDRAFDFVQQNRLAAAESTLTRVRAPDEETRARAAMLLAEVRGRRQIERALALVKAGKLAEARAAFAKVLPMDVPDPMKDYARTRMKDLDAATQGR